MGYVVTYCESPDVPVVHIDFLLRKIRVFKRVGFQMCVPDTMIRDNSNVCKTSSRSEGAGNLTSEIREVVFHVSTVRCGSISS